MLTKIPLVGVLLSGGQNDGVFGLSYRVHGSMSSPTLTVNPLSAIAPGILRRILGAIDGTTSRGGAEPPRQATRRRAGRRGRADCAANCSRARLERGDAVQGRPKDARLSTAMTASTPPAAARASCGRATA